MKKVYSLIGFAQKAGKTSSGAAAAKASVLRRRAYLLVLSSDIAENTMESLVSTCKKLNVPYIVMGNKYELGTSVGKAYRVAVTINDRNMADTVINAFKSSGERVKSMGVVEWPK